MIVDIDGRTHEYGALVDGEPCARLILVESITNAEFLATLEDGTMALVTDDRNTYGRCGRPKEEHERA